MYMHLYAKPLGEGMVYGAVLEVDLKLFIELHKMPGMVDTMNISYLCACNKTYPMDISLLGPALRTPGRSCCNSSGVSQALCLLVLVVFVVSR